MISSIDEIYLIVLFIFPGYASLLAIRKVSINERTLSSFELLAWSSALSVVTYIIVFNLFGVIPYEELHSKIYNPYFLSLILGTSLGLGIIVGKLTQIFEGKDIYPRDCWLLFQNKLAKRGSWVIVYTKDGKEYRGILNYAGRTEADKELIITNATLIIRNDKHAPIIEFEPVAEMLFTKDDISRIAFYEHF